MFIFYYIYMTYSLPNSTTREQKRKKEEESSYLQEAYSLVDKRDKHIIKM